MIGRKSLALLVIAGLGASLAASPVAAAKKCKPLCREQIADCRADYSPKTNCTQTDRAAKRTCKKAFKRGRNLCRPNIIRACKAVTDETKCSPSGAFLDPTL
jgi:hypothetical protein